MKTNETNKTASPANGDIAKRARVAKQLLKMQDACRVYTRALDCGWPPARAAAAASRVESGAWEAFFVNPRLSYPHLKTPKGWD